MPGGTEVNYEQLQLDRAEIRNSISKVQFSATSDGWVNASFGLR